MQQRYVLAIWDVFTMSGSDACGAETVIAVIDGEQEVDRFIVNGKCQNPDGYRRGYDGRPGLSARLVSGPGRISFDVVA